VATVITGWAERWAPDFIETVRRFPLAIGLQALATVALIASINGWLASIDDTWWRIVAGLSTGALFSVAGRLFAESQADGGGRLGPFLNYSLPMLVGASFAIRDTTNFVPYLLPVIGTMWLSVSAFTAMGKGPAAEEQQDRFWWLNHRAVTGGVLAVAGFFLVLIAVYAIQESLAILFGVQTVDMFWRYLLPFAGALLAPVYWLSTIPSLDEFDPRHLTEPDFVSRAIGFIGQFILAPVLLAYAAILLAYTAEIVVTRQLPQGVLARMVLGFVTTGAATWLVLYPQFMRERALVRVFRRFWFWLTIVPLLLLGIAVWTRIASYGVTPERMIVVDGGIWAGGLALIFLSGRGDIRFIPAFAGLLLAVMSIGPWNIENEPQTDQAMRLEAAINAAGASGRGGTPHWTADNADRASSAVYYLIGDEKGRERLKTILSQHGFDYDTATSQASAVLASIGAESSASTEIQASTVRLSRPGGPGGLDLSATPIYLGPLTTWSGSAADSAGGRQFTLTDNNTLEISAADGTRTVADLSPWAINRQAGGFSKPSIDFDLAGAHLRLVIDSVELYGLDSGPQKVTYLTGTLFAAAKSTP
jgi:hypothetical protein